MKLKVILDNGDGLWLVAEDSKLYVHNYNHNPALLIKDMGILLSTVDVLDDFEGNQLDEFTGIDDNFDNLVILLTRGGGQVVAELEEDRFSQKLITTPLFWVLIS